MSVIRPRFGKYLDILERRNMTNEAYEYSFEAFAELAALTEYDMFRDRHWQSMVYYCDPCNFNYDFIAKQESTDTDHPTMLDISGMI